jgi:hypothetical protein
MSLFLGPHFYVLLALDLDLGDRFGRLPDQASPLAYGLYPRPEFG